MEDGHVLPLVWAACPPPSPPHLYSVGNGSVVELSYTKHNNKYKHLHVNLLPSLFFSVFSLFLLCRQAILSYLL